MHKQGEDIHLLLELNGWLNVSGHYYGLRRTAIGHLAESIEQH